MRPSASARLLILVTESWLALVLAAFVVIRIVGSSVGQRVAHSLFGH